jgi:NAD(P)-dependent dehydrogenase (short-subunit alcohol dehydrogenase family)
MKRTVLITGATGVIGGATALELAKNDCRLILLGRDAEKLAVVKSDLVKSSGNSDIDFFLADLSEPKSIKNAVNEVKKKYTELNALINVAAIFKSRRLQNSAGLEFMFATNHLGPFILTTELLGLLKAGKPSKVITVSAPSTTKINFDDLQGTKAFSAGFMGAFGASKMMNLMFTYALARRIEGTGVTTNVVHPGLVKSGLTREMPAALYFIIKQFSGTPDKGAKMISRLILDKRYSDSNGVFYNASGNELKSSKYSYDTAIQEKLWTLSENLSK